MSAEGVAMPVYPFDKGTQYFTEGPLTLCASNPAATAPACSSVTIVPYPGTGSCVIFVAVSIQQSLIERLPVVGTESSCHFLPAGIYLSVITSPETVLPEFVKLFVLSLYEAVPVAPRKQRDVIAAE